VAVGVYCGALQETAMSSIRQVHCQDMRLIVGCRSYLHSYPDSSAIVTLLVAELTQVELVVHGGHQGSSLRPVAARQPSIRWGRYWIFFSLRLTMRTRPSRSAAAKLTMERLSSDQMPSAGLRSGA